jgi:hypothetical protein
MFKSHQIKSDHRVLRKNKVDTLFAPDYSANVLAAKMCTNSSDHFCILDFYDWLAQFCCRSS